MHIQGSKVLEPKSTSKYKQDLTNLGFGLGFRNKHYQSIITENPNIDWFEVITENFMVDGGVPIKILHKLRQDYPIVMHGVSLSIGSVDPINLEYLKKLKTLINNFEPRWVSDHLCWTGINGINSHDLLPLPYTEESLKHVVARITQVQDYLGRQILLENPSSYFEFKENEIFEWDFLAEVAIQSDCLILLDINNIYVSSKNFKFNPIDYLDVMPKNKIQQFHLAGHIQEDDYLIDTHGTPVKLDVWELYAKAINRFGMVSTIIERDTNIPPLSELLLELDKARVIAKEVCESSVTETVPSKLNLECSYP